MMNVDLTDAATRVVQSANRQVMRCCEWMSGHKFSSPIEFMFATGFAIVGRLHSTRITMDWIPKRTEAECRELMARCSWGSAIFPQVKIGVHTVDFLYLYHADDELVGMVIECDGHAFHERTKQQARADKSRDRTLQGSGYKVLRFTGSEIWADACGCALSVIQMSDDDRIDRIMRIEAIRETAVASAPT